MEREASSARPSKHRWATSPAHCHRPGQTPSRWRAVGGPFRNPLRGPTSTLAQQSHLQHAAGRAVQPSTWSRITALLIAGVTYGPTATGPNARSVRPCANWPDLLLPSLLARPALATWLLWGPQKLVLSAGKAPHGCPFSHSGLHLIVPPWRGLPWPSGPPFSPGPT